MQKYELLLVFAPTLSEEEVKGQIDRYSEIINKNGKVENVDEWGLKKLAYKIDNKYREGYYVIIDFESTPEVLDELNHIYLITESILRNMITKKED